MASSHISIDPAILYWGTPVVLISTVNSDGSHNIAPISSVFFLSHSCMLGISTSSCTTANILRTGECVLNLASDDMVGAVNALAKTTGSNPVPQKKIDRGYVHVKDKFAAAGFTKLESDKVAPPGISECPVVMEAHVTGVYDMLGSTPERGGVKAIEVEIVKVRVHARLKKDGYANRIDPDVWNPMIMSFCELYGVNRARIGNSRLAEIDEELYRPPKPAPVERRDPDTAPTARLVFVHGFSDHCNAYYDLFPTLASPPYSILVNSFDQRGWGQSVHSEGERGLTGPTSTVLDDINQFVKSVSDPTLPVFVMGHSMGGGQALHYILTKDPAIVGTRPPIVGVILEAPFVALDPASAPNPIVVAVGKLAAKFLPNRQLYQPLSATYMSRSEKVRNDWVEDRLCHDTGTLAGLDGMLQRSADLVSLSQGKPVPNLTNKLPTGTSLWASHGDSDKILSFDATQRLYDVIQVDGGDKQFKVYPGAYHKLHAEPDEVGDQFTKDVGDWILSKAKAWERPGPNDEEKQLATSLPTTQNRTLLPGPVAALVSAGTGIGALGVKAGTRVAGWGLYAGREGALRTLSLGRTAAEGIFFLAGQDVALHTTSELGQQDAAHILARAIGLLNSTISTASFIASSGFYTTEVILKSVSASTEKTLAILNAVFGSTESSKAVASVITLLTNELNKPETGEVLSYFSILSGVISFVLLQRWGRRKTLLDFRDSGGEVPVWDVVVDDRGFRADVVGTRRQETITLTTAAAAPTMTFMSPDAEEEFEALERGTLFGDGPPILNEDDQTIPSDEEIYARIAAQVPEDAVVNITTETIQAKTIRVDIRHKKAAHIEPPRGTIMVAERLNHGQPGEGDGPSQTIIFRTALKRSNSTEIGPYKEIQPKPSDEINDALDAEESLVMAAAPSEQAGEEPTGTIQLDEEPGAEQVDHDPSAGPDPAHSPVANQKKSRRPVLIQSNSTSKIPVQSAPPKDKQAKTSRQEAGNRIKRAFKTLSPTSSSTALKDSHTLLPRRKAPADKPLPRLPRFTSPSEATVITPARIYPLAARSNGHSPLPSPMITSSPQTTNTTYFSVQRSRRNSGVEQTDTYSIQSGSRSGSPTFRRTHTRTTSGIPKTRSELSLQETTDARRDGLRHHQRSRSFVPSLYSMASKHSDEAVVLQPRRPVPRKSIYEDSAMLNQLVDEGTVPGIFPDRHLVKSVRRFCRFATASYGSSFLHLMGLTSEGKPREKLTELTALNVDHHEHESFSAHTGLPADTILLSSFYDPQGVTGNTEWSSSAFSPLTHFVSLDHESKAVVLTCRGTLGFEDILTDLTCDYDDLVWQGQSYKVHRGIHASARRLLSGNGSRVMATIKASLEEFSDYGLVLCGHSLGGAVAALVAILISEPTHNTTGQAFVTKASPKLLTNVSSPSSSRTEAAPVVLPSGRPIHVYSYGTPATVSEPLRLVTRGLITTVVNASDFVPSLSLGTFHDLRAVALHLKHDASDARNKLVDRVWSRIRSFLLLSHDTGVHGPPMPEMAGDGVGEDQWAWNLLQQLRGKMTNFKLVPAGEIFVLEMTRVFDRLGVDVKQEATFGADLNDDNKTEKVYRALGRPATRVQFKWVRDVPARFAELKFGRDMFGDHSPGRYESVLKHLEGAICDE
ncbi:hypothetical protein DV738_g3417, partial [Chaetothyriales sp. CBS 135597]